MSQELLSISLSRSLAFKCILWFRFIFLLLSVFLFLDENCCGFHLCHMCAVMSVASEWKAAISTSKQPHLYIHVFCIEYYNRVAYIAPLCIRLQIFTGFLWLFDQIYTHSTIPDAISSISREKKPLLLDNGAPFCHTNNFYNSLSFRENTFFFYFRFIFLLLCPRWNRKKKSIDQEMMVLKRLCGLQTTIFIELLKSKNVQDFTYGLWLKYTTQNVV